MSKRKKLTHAQVLMRMRKALRKRLVEELTRQGVILLPGSKVRYGDLVRPVTWRFDYGNLTLWSDIGGQSWLTGRASTPDVNAEEPVYVGVHVSVLLNMGR